MMLFSTMSIAASMDSDTLNNILLPTVKLTHDKCVEQITNKDIVDAFKKGMSDNGYRFPTTGDAQIDMYLACMGLQFDTYANTYAEKYGKGEDI
jgi:hypothetical protein